MWDEASLYWRANALCRQLREPAVAEAVGLLRRLLIVQPGHDWGLSLLAFCRALQAAAGWDEAASACCEAREAIDQALGLSGSDPFVLGYCAGAQWMLGDDDGIAESFVALALQLQPGLPAALLWGAAIDLSRGDFIRARTRIGQAKRLYPAAAAISILSAGLDLCEQAAWRNGDAAIHALECAADHDPAVSAILATALFADGCPEKAGTIFQRLGATSSRALVTHLARNGTLRAVFDAGFA